MIDSKKNYYYIHGYGSTGKTTYNGLKLAGLSNLKLVQWTSDKPFNETLAEIESQIDLNSETVVIASSFGGYFAARLHYNNLAYVVLVNPLIDPIASYNAVHYSKNFTKEIANTYYNRKDTIRGNGYPITLFLSQNDEVLNWHEADTYFKGYCNRIFINDGHQLKDYSIVANNVKKFENYIAD